MKDPVKYFAAFFSLIAILLVLVLVLATKKPAAPDIVNRPLTLTDYENSDVTLRVTVDGPVVALENHRAVRISVGRGLRSVEVYKGYNFEIERSRDYGNEQNAFVVFVRALQRTGFTSRTKDEDRLSQTDERGICANGQRYIYEIIDNSEQVLRSWSSSCEETGTFAGNRGAVFQLFRNQIPDYGEVTRGVSL